MRGSWRVGRIMGIDISIHASWFIILFLMVYSFGFVEFPRVLHPWAWQAPADAASIWLGLAVSLLLFASVLAHELAHSWMAIERGIPVLDITLFVFGGVAQISDEPDRPASEFLIALMGPLMSLALAAVWGAAWIWLRVLAGGNPANLLLVSLILLTGILAQANAALAIFNLAPGFPLDGGRVLRAVLWGALHNIVRATRIATRVGQGIAVLLIGLGLWRFAGDLDLNGLWYVLVGAFVWNAAGEGYRQTVIREALRGVRVLELTRRDVTAVPPELALAAFVSDYAIPQRARTFVVAGRDAAVLGTISVRQVQSVPRDQWAIRTVREVMLARANLAPLDSQQTAAEALAQLARARGEELPVLAGDTLIGFCDRESVMRFLELQAGIAKN